MNKEYKIPEADTSAFTSIAIYTLLFPLTMYILYKVVGFHGEILVLLLWPLALYTVFALYAKKRNFITISEQGIAISQQKNVVYLNWSEISELSIQVVIAKRLGFREGIPTLALRLTPDALQKTNKLIAKEFGFIQTPSVLSRYKVRTEMSDLYISLAQMKEEDSELVTLLSSQPIYVKTQNPVIKTDSQTEYDAIVKENFTA